MAISLKASGTWAGQTADGTVTIPGTPAAGDRMFLWLGWKHRDHPEPATPSGWTAIGTMFEDGTVQGGVGTGSMRLMAYFRDWQSGDTDPNIDYNIGVGTLSQGMVVIELWQKAASEAWDTPLTVTAAIALATTWDATASSTVDVPSGGVVFCHVAFRDDSATMTRATDAIDDSGALVTWNGNYVESPATHHSSITNNDQSCDLGHRLVTTGASGVTLHADGTLAANETGAARWVIQGVSIAPIVRTWTEAITTSDVWTRTGTFLRALTEAPVTSDVFTRSGTFLRSLTEAVTTSDVWAQAKIITRTMTESLTSSDIWTRAGTFVRTLTEAVTTSDVWARLLTAVRTSTEVLSTSDIWTRVGTLVRSVTEAVATSDAWVAIKSGGGVIMRSWSEAASTSDAWTGVVRLVGGIRPLIASIIHPKPRDR